MDFLGVGPLEFLLILVVALLVMGPQQLPQVARRLGDLLNQAREFTTEARESLLIDLDSETPQEPEASQEGKGPQRVERRRRR